ncbi:MAG: NAD(P)(+) transhydrogenase (Re/Si-specific) subunit beta, partial [Candidatus Eremiobacteraeota bacterium]|nr:NAD(P)(+) transhydrogenase (Re/Si-specific) subunit beta [Candidatus Eremiobacteraeota bacterium]
MTATITLVRIAELAAISLFILGLHFLSSPATARFGNRLAAIGMLLALIAVAISTGGMGWWAILIGVVIGAAIGLFSALRVQMTAMPQMVALFNGAGGGAAALISTVEYVQISHSGLGGSSPFLIPVSLVVSAIIGAISFGGSIVAFMKLQEWMPGRPMTYPGQQIVNGLVLLAIVILAGWLVAVLLGLPFSIYLAMLGAALLLGVLFVLPIGGADMPVVISLLNSFTGLAVAIAGFELGY